MRAFVLFFLLIGTLPASAQEERDTTLSRCPVFILDTVSNNNFFLSARPATIKTYRVKSDLTVVVQQRDQFFTLFFNGKKLRETVYKIKSYPRSNNEMLVRYSFKEDGQVSYVDMSGGTVEVTFDKEKEIWWVKVNGMITDYVGSMASNYKVKAELPLK